MKVLLPVIAIAVVAGTLGFGYTWYSFSHKAADPAGQEKLVEVSSGMSTREIGKRLREGGLVRSELAFYIDVRLHDDILQAGVYRLSGALGMNDIITALVEGKVAEHIITIPEGWRLIEIAALFNEKGIVPKQDFLKAAEDKEGYLFPDTYRFPLNVTTAEIVKRMRENFDTRTEGMTLKRPDIILASIVEREAKNDDERTKIAAVYLNRLKRSMRLEADPTVQYAKTLVDSTVNESWPKITTDDYRSVQSSYNSYLNDGLPPGPICNPGFASLKAVLSPAQIDDLYFFHTADGQTIFSKTLDEHNARKKQYNLAI